MSINQSTIMQGDSVRATYAEVNLSRLRNNLKIITDKVAPSRVMIIIKANAYGHGMVEIARALAGKVDYMGVAVLEEGILLRKLGIQTPLIVLGGIWGEQVPQYLKYDLVFTASSVERLEQINQAAEIARKKAKVHLKIDTGMERIGVHYYNARSLQDAALKCKYVEVEGIFSHFASADSTNLSYTKLQLERFNDVLDFYEKRSLPLPIRHIANSGAILQMPESFFDMVRPGILLYGVYPSKDVPRTLDVKPIMEWKSKVVYFKIVHSGNPVSYNSTWRSDHPVRIVTVPVGYGDGYFRSMSNKAQVIIRGKKYPQVGLICMDQLMVNIESDSAFNGDDIVLMGEEEGASITAEDLAFWAGTIPYEILTNINTRVPRLYYEEKQ